MHRSAIVNGLVRDVECDRTVSLTPLVDDTFKRGSRHFRRRNRPTTRELHLRFGFAAMPSASHGFVFLLLGIVIAWIWGEESVAQMTVKHMIERMRRLRLRLQSPHPIDRTSERNPRGRAHPGTRARMTILTSSNYRCRLPTACAPDRVAV